MRVLFFHLFSTFFQSHTYNLTTIILYDEQGIYEIICKIIFSILPLGFSHRFKNLNQHLLIRGTLKF